MFYTCCGPHTSDLIASVDSTHSMDVGVLNEEVGREREGEERKRRERKERKRKTRKYFGHFSDFTFGASEPFLAHRPKAHLEAYSGGGGFWTPNVGLF